MATFNSTITGSNTGDTLLGTEASQYINAGTGNDSISSTFSLSSILANAGNDTIGAVGASTTVYGGSGSDSFYFVDDLSNVLLAGNQDNDTVQIFAGATASSIWGGSGDDSIKIGGDADATAELDLIVADYRL